MYDPDLRTVIRKAFFLMQDDAKAGGSFLGGRIINWIQSVYKTEQPEDAFVNLESFPLFLLPWYAELTINPEPEKDFQTDLVYSTLQGYYYIRFMDNLMDGHNAQNLVDLPILNFFSMNFQAPYNKYFPDDHPFWKYFNSVWLHSAEVNIIDVQLSDIDKDLFQAVSAQKTCAVKIPVAAVFFNYDYPERIQQWEQFIDIFGRWHQMLDDIRDFPEDEREKHCTYFLSEAQRKKRPDELVVDWVIREGHDWGVKILNDWMAQMEEMATELKSPLLSKYLNYRKQTFSEQEQNSKLALLNLQEILSSLKHG